MVILWGGRTEALLPLIKDALQRGVEVRIVGDIFSKYESQKAKLGKHGEAHSWKHTTEVTKRLASQGARITYVGKLGINPFKGRTHSKITVIDDMVYTFGGINFSDAHFGYQDYMFEMDDADIAQRAYDIVEDIEKHPTAALPNITSRIDDETTLLFDGGNPRDSVIYDATCAAIANAKKVYYVSKMCPSGELATLLSGRENECYFNRYELESVPDKFAIAFDQARYDISNKYSANKHIHAKFILCENADGSRELVTGSNNFSWRGIAFGTKEIAMHSTNPEIWDMLYSFLQREIEQN
jgi:phosphatidylserine/phosphatidylglycerophosphate/cardiolipin synthase-like enzyme